MRFLLDTNVCIRFLNGRAPRIRERLLIAADGDVAISSITVAEMFYGSAKSQNPQLSRTRQEHFFSRFTILSFDAAAAGYYAATRAHLERQGLPIGQLDLLIASTALANHLILVTHNLREFTRVPGLRVEDWEEV